MQAVVGATPGFEVDVELGELQLHVANVMQEEHEEAYIVVPMGWEQSTRTTEPGPHGFLLLIVF